MTNSKSFYAGQIVFDRRRTDPTDDLLVVVDYEPRPLLSFTGEKYRLIKHNNHNKSFYGGPVPDDALCVTAAYVTDDSNSPAVIGNETYTFPIKRLETIQAPDDAATAGYYPHQLALASFLGELVQALDGNEICIESVSDLQVLCMEAAVDGSVIKHGTNIGLGRETTSPTR